MQDEVLMYNSVYRFFSYICKNMYTQTNRYNKNERKNLIFFKSSKINNEEGVLTKSLISTAFKIILFFNTKTSRMGHLSYLLLFLFVESSLVDRRSYILLCHILPKFIVLDRKNNRN